VNEEISLLEQEIIRWVVSKNPEISWPAICEIELVRRVNNGFGRLTHLRSASPFDKRVTSRLVEGPYLHLQSLAAKANVVLSFEDDGNFAIEIAPNPPDDHWSGEEDGFYFSD
jgi:hypothetical protein